MRGSDEGGVAMGEPRVPWCSPGEAAGSGRVPADRVPLSGSCLRPPRGALVAAEKRPVHPPTAAPRACPCDAGALRAPRGTGKVPSWDKRSPRVVLLASGHTRHVHEVPEVRDFVRMWLEGA